MSFYCPPLVFAHFLPLPAHTPTTTTCPIFIVQLVQSLHAAILVRQSGVSFAFTTLHAHTRPYACPFTILHMKSDPACTRKTGKRRLLTHYIYTITPARTRAHTALHGYTCAPHAPLRAYQRCAPYYYIFCCRAFRIYLWRVRLGCFVRGMARRVRMRYSSWWLPLSMRRCARRAPRARDASIFAVARLSLSLCWCGDCCAAFSSPSATRSATCARARGAACLLCEHSSRQTVGRRVACAARVTACVARPA